MNILLIGEHHEHLKRLKGLLEITFPKAMIAAGGLESSYRYILDYNDKWNLVIFMPFLEETKIEGNELLLMCKSMSLPVLCIVNRDSNSNHHEIFKMGVKGIVGLDAPLDIHLDAIRFIKEGGVYFDPKIVKNFDLLGTLEKIPKENRPSLTKNQWKVFRLIARGMSIEVISLQLEEDTTTISEYKEEIMKLTNSKTNAGAVAKAFFNKWLTSN